MIAELGHYALILALAVAVVQGVLPIWGAHKRNAALVALARPAAQTQFVLVLVAFMCLMQGFISSDFSVLNVAENSHSDKPMLYKIAGVWGNHEGSLLLWVLILTLFGAMVARFGANLPEDFRARVLSIQALIGVGFLCFILFTSNPFTRLFPPPIDGRGLNPLLQDPGLAFHPPFLYLGYVGLSVAFSFAVAALIEGRVDAAWARWVRPWTLAAWIFLTIGIALGSWWAYYELGWGGWWFWDPVENASFMPWLAATALLHSAIVVEKRDTLKSWTILLAILGFGMSLLGTFLVRSGVLTSVHAFATDPTRGVFILAFFVFVVGGALMLYTWRAPLLKSSSMFKPISREGLLLLNNLILVTALATVFLGTLYPLLLDALTGEKVSVGAPFFNATFIPVMTPVLVAMAIGPFLPWKRGELLQVLSKLKIAAVLMVVMSALFWWVFYGGPVLALFGFALAFWLIFAALFEIGERVKLGRAGIGESLRRAKNLPRAAWGMTLAHGGVGLVILAITASTFGQDEKLTLLNPGDNVAVGPFNLTFRGVREVPGPNYMARQGTFSVEENGELVTVLIPEQRQYPTPPMPTTEAAIRTTLAGDLYTVIGDPDPAGGFAVRLYWKPLVAWGWIGIALMSIGGIFSLTDRRLRVGAPRQTRTGSSAAAPQPAE